MKRMLRVRNSISRVLVLVGIVLLLFGILWWVLAVNRLVRYPSSVDLTMLSEGTVERLAARHGLLPYDPPEKAELELENIVFSINEGYTSSTAEVAENSKCLSGPLPGGIELDDQNVYVIDRRDCINRKSPRSTSAGTVVDRSGSWTVNFPLGTDRTSYNVFNNDVGSSFAVNFVKEDTVNGVKAYVFEGSFRHRPMVDHRVEAMGLPEATTYGDIKKELESAGIPIDALLQTASGTLTAEERATIDSFTDDLPVRLDYMVEYAWEAAVEPVTGSIINVSSDETRVFVNSDVKTFLPLFEVLANHAEDPLVVQYLSQLDQQKVLEPKELFRIRTSWTENTSDRMAESANGRIGPIRFIKDYMTYLFLILGAVMVTGGLVLRSERRLPHLRRGTPAPEGEEKRGDDVAP